MGSETEKFFKAWSTVYASVVFCYLVIRKIPPGVIRLIALIPIISIFILLPLNLSSIHYITVISFLITWLANFKLVLFAFNQGPLSSNPSIPLTHFISIACLPINIKDHSSMKKPFKSRTNYIIKSVLLALFIPMYKNKHNFNPFVTVVVLWSYLYLFFEVLFVMMVAPIQATLKIEIEAQFDEPFLSSSLHDFWSRRWNLMVPNVLRPTIHCPIQSFLTPIIGKKYAIIPAMLASFLVSGLMHELIYFYITRVQPTWEMTLYFLFNGVCLVLEIATKKALSGRWLLHPWISVPLVSGFIGFTSFWLCSPQLLRNGVSDRIAEEHTLVIEFVKNALSLQA